MSKQIDEVMALADEFALKTDAYQNGEVSRADLFAARRAVKDKLRELLPVWQPIWSAPKDVCTEFDGWNGERVTNVSWGWPDYHPKEKRCWIRSVYETGYGWISEEVNGLTHWMPLPAPPSDEGAT